MQRRAGLTYRIAAQRKAVRDYLAVARLADARERIDRLKRERSTINRAPS